MYICLFIFVSLLSMQINMENSGSVEVAFDGEYHEFIGFTLEVIYCHSRTNWRQIGKQDRACTWICIKWMLQSIFSMSILGNNILWMSEMFPSFPLLTHLSSKYANFPYRPWYRSNLFWINGQNVRYRHFHRSKICYIRWILFLENCSTISCLQ